MRVLLGESKRSKLCNKGRHDLYCTANRWMKQMVHVARVGMNINTSTNFSNGTQGKRSFAVGHKYIHNRDLQK